LFEKSERDYCVSIDSGYQKKLTATLNSMKNLSDNLFQKKIDYAYCGIGLISILLLLLFSSPLFSHRNIMNIAEQDHATSVNEYLQMFFEFSNPPCIYRCLNHLCGANKEQ